MAARGSSWRSSLDQEGDDLAPIREAGPGDHLVAEVVRDPRREAARAGLAHEDLEEGRPGLLIGAPLPQVANLEARDHGEEDHRARDAALLDLHHALLGDE